MTAVDPFVMQQAEIRASRMVGNHGFTRDDWEDLRQDLLLDYLERLPQFNPCRGDERGFMFGVVRHRAAQLVARQRRRTQLAQTEHADACEVHGLSENHDLRIDIEAAVSRLPVHLRKVALLLREKTPSEVCRVTGKSRSRIYQLIEEIRAAFEDAGVTLSALRRSGGVR